MALKRTLAVAAGVGLLVSTGCGEDGSGDPRGGAGGELPDGRTFLSTSMTDGDVVRPLVDGTRIRLEFAGDNLRAYAGCNYLGFGNARQEDDRLVAGQASGTDIGCDPKRLDQDDWLAEFLTSEPTLRLDGDSLSLTSEEVTIELREIEVATPDRPLVGTRWRINTILDGQSANSFGAQYEAYLIFRYDGTVRGHTACNAFRAHYEVDGSTLSTSRLVAETAPCEGYAAELEAALVDVLSGDSTIAIETNQLTLTAADGKGVSLRTNL
jgi:heat shock protein HslJ